MADATIVLGNGANRISEPNEAQTHERQRHGRLPRQFFHQVLYGGHVAVYVVLIVIVVVAGSRWHSDHYRGSDGQVFGGRDTVAHAGGAAAVSLYGAAVHSERGELDIVLDLGLGENLVAIHFSTRVPPEKNRKK